MSGDRKGQIVTFYSYKGGTGRTMALANVAWILAANGKRVLAVDWDLESPGLHRFYGPFIDPEVLAGTGGVIDMIRRYEDETRRDEQRPLGWVAEFAKLRDAFSLTWDFPADGCLDYLAAGRQNGDYATTMGGLDWDEFYNRRGGGVFFDALGAEMRRCYDYTLIDSRTGLSDVADICTIHLPDTLVDCFTLSDQGISGAARVARSVQRYSDRKRSIRILPVAMRVDQDEKEKVDAGRRYAMRQLAELPAGLSEDERRRYWLRVEVPYRTFYAYEETLATFGDRPGSPTSLLASYEALTAAVSRDQVVAMPEVGEALRLHWRDRFVRRLGPIAEEVVLRYAPADQAWAEWIGWVFTVCGVRVRDPWREGPGGEPVLPNLPTLTIVSAAPLDDSVRLPRVNRGSPQFAALVADAPSWRAPAGIRSVSVSGLTAATAGRRLLDLIEQVPDALAEAGPEAPRFPGSEPAVFEVPARNPLFTGREDDLRHLRRQLQRGGSAVVLNGMGGVGKTQIAMEYAHRFRTAYDTIWWIAADPSTFIDVALVSLGHWIGVTPAPGASVRDNVRHVLEALAKRDAARRWLLVFDNADDIADVAEYLPAGAGHVLVTSRNPDWAERARLVQVDVFSRDESVAHLVERAPSLTADEADRVAEVLGDLPIAVAAAGAWLADTGIPADEYADLVKSNPTGLLRLEATWELSLQRLRERSAAAFQLLQLCSVLGPEIALDLLNSEAVARWLAPLDPSVAEPVMRAALVQHLNRLALLKLDRAARKVHVHRLLSVAVRDRMSPAELGQVQGQAQLMLAAARPTEEGAVDDPANWARYENLWPHLEPCDAVHSTDARVQTLLIDRVRYLERRGENDQADEDSRPIEAAWEDALAQQPAGPDRDGAARRLLLLRFNRANVLRNLARFEQARLLDQANLEAQTALLGRGHPHTLMSAGSLAGDLRALGAFGEALELDTGTHAAWLEMFGADHLRRLSAANNLATSYRLLGDFQEAERLDREVYLRRVDVLGPGHPYTLHSASCIGRDLREAGEYLQSVEHLRQVLHEAQTRLGRDVLDTLVVRVNLAISLRSAGNADAAAQMLDDALTHLTARYRSNPHTLLCHLARATNLLARADLAPDAEQREAGYRQAEIEMTAVLRLHHEAYGAAHPHTLICRSNLAATQRALGQPARALTSAEDAVRGLRDQVGAEHPFTLAARTNRAILFAETGGRTAAEVEMRELTGLAAARLGTSHPDTLRGEANLAILRGDQAQLGRAIDALADRIGADRPTVRALRQRRYAHRVVDPQPF